MRALALALALLAPALAQADTGSGESVSKRGQLDDDFYVAAGNVDIDAEVNGDVIAAGGELMIGRRIDGDVIAAGGRLRIHGEVYDDVRIAGGDLDVDARIGDDLVAAGGAIVLSPQTRVGGNAWLSGGDVYVAGTIVGDLKVAAGRIRLSGTVQGDVELESGEIEILDDAVILGKLTYSSPREADTHEGARIEGSVDYEAADWDYEDRGFGLFFSITLIVAGIMLHLLFPHYTRASSRRIATDPWSSLGLGFVFVVMIPLAAILLMLIVLGLWVGLTLLALYCVALLTGFLIACFFLGERGAMLFKQDVSATGRRLISLAAAIFVLGLVQTIPLLGGLILFLLLLLGLGAGVMQLRYVYRPMDTAG